MALHHRNESGKKTSGSNSSRGREVEQRKTTVASVKIVQAFICSLKLLLKIAMRNVLVLISFFIVYFLSGCMHACMCALFHYAAPMFQPMYSLAPAISQFLLFFCFSCFNFLLNCLCNFHYRRCTHTLALTHTRSNKVFNLSHAYTLAFHIPTNQLFEKLKNKRKTKYSEQKLKRKLEEVYPFYHENYFST